MIQDLMQPYIENYIISYEIYINIRAEAALMYA